MVRIALYPGREFGIQCHPILKGEILTTLPNRTGYALWTLGAGLVLLFSRTTPRWQIVIILIVEGAGVGFVFQPTLVAAQAHSLKRDRAVVISVRNFLRAFGGALGLALSSAVFSNSLKSALNSKSTSTALPSGYIAEILASILRVPDLSTLTAGQKEEVLNAYMTASRSVFLIWAPVMGLCLILCFLIKDKGLQRAEEKVVVVQEEESGSEGVQTPAGMESDLEAQKTAMEGCKEK